MFIFVISCYRYYLQQIGSNYFILNLYELMDYEYEVKSSELVKIEWICTCMLRIIIKLQEHFKSY
jgi:hypothetical protein